MKGDDGLPACYHSTYRRLEEIAGKLEADFNIERVYAGVLDIHHQNGNHFDNTDGNPITICSNTHRVDTMYHEHYNNRYPNIK